MANGHVFPYDQKQNLPNIIFNKYKMSITGMTLSLEVPEIIELIKQYSHEE